MVVHFIFTFFLDMPLTYSGMITFFAIHPTGCHQLDEFSIRELGLIELLPAGTHRPISDSKIILNSRELRMTRLIHNSSMPNQSGTTQELELFQARGVFIIKSRDWLVGICNSQSLL
jgi:hypothetical protein